MHINVFNFKFKQFTQSAVISVMYVTYVCNYKLLDYHVIFFIYFHHILSKCDFCNKSLVFAILSIIVKIFFQKGFLSEYLFFHEFRN